MFLTNKKKGETPLELLERIRLEKPELKSEKLSYIGRLDPMAEGEIIILVGEENKNYKDYLGFDKEYEAEFIFGFSTDTGDVLGKITGSVLPSEISCNEIKKVITDFINLKEQTYPWFSSKTVKGKKLFEYFKEGEIENIERPKREVKIYSTQVLNDCEKISAQKLEENILNSIGTLSGKNDFRQKEIVQIWKDFFADKRDEGFLTIKIKIKVGTGTYIRALTELFTFPATLLSLKRTKVFVD